MQRVIRRLGGNGWLSLGILLVLALILRAATLGDPIIHIDENFYLQVGAAMHHGAVPYVDIWDRKPLGIFIIYWAIAGLSVSPWVYQIAALLSAAATAWVIARIARLWTGRTAAILAGISYLAMLNVFDGMGGQSPVFYNLLIAQAGYLILARWPGTDVTKFRRAHLLAMALCGLAMTIKQTTLFESAMFGLAGLFWLRRNGAGPAGFLRHALPAITIALAPTAMIAAWYAGHGWWGEWYHAMVTSNVRREGIGEASLQHNLVALSRLIGVYVGVAVIGLVGQGQDSPFRPYRGVMLCWLLIAVASLSTVPNFFSHYMLPILVPLTPLAALGFDRRTYGLPLFAINLIVAVVLGTAFDFRMHRASRQAYEEMALTIERYRGARPLLIMYGPPLLYTSTDSRPMSPLVFPEHLENDLETNTSPIRTMPEIERMIAARPAVVVMPMRFELRPTDGRIELVERYLASNCRDVWRGTYYEPRGVPRAEIIYACR